MKKLKIIEDYRSASEVHDDVIKKTKGKNESVIKEAEKYLKETKKN
jgi:hypothetical protein